MMEHGGKPWLADYNTPNFLAGRKAMKEGLKYVLFC